MKGSERRKIRQDKFLEVIKKALDFARHRKREIYFGLAAVAVIVALLVGIQMLQATGVKRQSRILTQILELSEGIKDNPENVDLLQDLAGNGRYERMAYIKLAAHWISQDDPSQAEAALSQFPDKTRDLIYYQARDMTAQVYLYQKRWDEALAIYDWMKENPGPYSLDLISFHRAEVLEKKGDVEMALTVYKEVEREFPQSAFGYEASKKVRFLEGK